MAHSSSAEHVVVIGGGATSALIAVRLGRWSGCNTASGGTATSMTFCTVLLMCVSSQ